MEKEVWEGRNRCRKCLWKDRISDRHRLKDAETSETVIDVSPEMPMNRGMEDEGEGGEG